MICIPHNPILLVTETDVTPHTSVRDGQVHDAGPWLELRSQHVGEVMREVLVRKPGALIFDTSWAKPDSDPTVFALKAISTVRGRTPRLLIAALGPVDSPDIESRLRQAGATVYLPTHAHKARDTLRRFIEAAGVRDGPARVHGPPASGVPPR